MCGSRLENLLHSAERHESLFQMLRGSGAENKETNSNMRDHQHNVGETVMPKFKIVKVHSFRIGGKRYAKGDVVELSEEDAERFKGADFLEPVEEERKPEKCVEKAEYPKFAFSFLTLMFKTSYNVVPTMQYLERALANCVVARDRFRYSFEPKARV